MISKSRNPKQVLSALSLAIGILLPMFIHPAVGPRLNWLHAISGFCLGFSLVLTCFLLVEKRHRRACSPPDGLSS